MASPRFTFRDTTSTPAKKQRKETENTPSKRQKFRSLFTDDTSSSNSEVDKYINFIKTSFQHAQEEKLSEENLLSALVIVYGLPVVVNLLGALSHVPSTFVDRITYVANIVNVNKEHMKPCEIQKVAGLLQRYADVNHCAMESEVLWKCTHSYGEGYLVFLVPPVTECLECGGSLYSFNKTEITLFTLEGPKPGMKVTKRCKKGCLSIYNIDRYLVPGGGTSFYKTAQSVISASNCVYMSRDVHELMCEAANHAFVSHHAFSEIYNSLFSTSVHAEEFQKWLESSRKKPGDDEDLPEVLESLSDDHIDEIKEEPQFRHLLSRKKAINCYLNGELMNELQERTDLDLKIGPGESRETLMRQIDETRRTEIYEHKQCGQICKQKGCETLRVIDSCWKVCMPHCMFAVEMEVEGMPLINFPNVCTNEPMPQSVFCEHHHQMLEANGIPTKKDEFLKYIGCKERPFNSEDILEVDRNTVKLSRELKKKDMLSCADYTSSQYQGTAEVVSKINPNHWDTDVKCNKDTGQKSRLRQRSRGHFICVTGGGHIQYFEPIFKSESPGQVFLIVLRVMMLELSNVPEEKLDEAIESFVLSYDNMCQLDSLKASKEPLPFPAPYDLMWGKIKKIIDRLHISNHKDEKCKQLYNPNQIPDEHNTMIAEQTFAWFSRFKKIVNSMSQSHHLFYVHRNIKRRNRYTEKCRAKGRIPLLPGINTKIGMKMKK